jgi:hypothetical protein
MGTTSNIVSLSAFTEAEEFSSEPASSEKIVSESPMLENAKAPGNKDLHASHAEHPHQASGETGKKGSKKKKKAKGKLKDPEVKPTLGPDGYKVDCDDMKATPLTKAYPREWNSWRNRKSRCTQFPDKYTWDKAWEVFRDFLRNTGPMPQDGKKYTLDRTDNTNGHYGPGRCQWATEIEQANNKSTNLKIIHPTTNEVFTSHKLAKKHRVKLKTIHHWKAKGYSDIEMIAGKQDKDLAALAESLPKPQLPTGKTSAPATITRDKTTDREVRIPAPPDIDWDPTDEEIGHFNATGEQLDSRYVEKRAEYDALVVWIERYNAGRPVPPQPPQGKYYKYRAPARGTAKPPAPRLPNRYVDDFDPADCNNPRDYGNFDDYEPEDDVE